MTTIQEFGAAMASAYTSPLVTISAALEQFPKALDLHRGDKVTIEEMGRPPFRGVVTYRRTNKKTGVITLRFAPQTDT